MNKTIAPLTLVVEERQKGHIAGIAILAGGAFLHRQVAPAGSTKAGCDLIAPRLGDGLWVPGGNQIIPILNNKGAVARPH